jgi:hypothetical protein
LARKYQDYGFVILPIDYYEPYVPADKQMHTAAGFNDLEFNKMILGIFPATGSEFRPDNPHVISELVKAISLDHYGLPEDHWTIQRSLQSFEPKI